MPIMSRFPWHSDANFYNDRGVSYLNARYGGHTASIVIDTLIEPLE